jgi:hypothetical protein
MNARIVLRIGVLATLLGGSACVTTPPPMRAKTAADCQDAKTCAVSGLLEMSNDGHAYIGILRLADGSCINVSLPEARSQALVGKAPEAVEIAGRVLFFPFAEGAISFNVSGRKVGYGKCARYFLFVQ